MGINKNKFFSKLNKNNLKDKQQSINFIKYTLYVINND